MSFKIPWWKLVRAIDQRLFVRSDGRRRDRFFIGVIAVLLAVGVYVLAVHTFAPNRNIFVRGYRMARGVNNYEFHAGSESGNYFKIGKAIEDELGRLDIRVVSHEDGSSAIIDAILEESTAIGLVEDRYVQKLVNTGVAVRRIAPVYRERLHVLYSVDSWREHLEAQGLGDTLAFGPPQIEPAPENLVRSFFDSSSVRFKSSEPAAGEYPLGKQILEYCGLAPGDLTYQSFGRAFDNLENGSLDVAFITAGAPLARVDELLRSRGSNIALMALHPTLAEGLNSAFGESYRVTSFAGSGYPSAVTEMSTIATDAVLVASREVPDPVIGEVLGALETIAKYPPSESQKLPVVDYKDSIGQFEAARLDPRWEAAETWGLSVLGIGLTVVLFYYLGNSLLSAAKHTGFSAEISAVYFSSLPDNSELAKEADMDLPELDTSIEANRKFVSNIIQGIARLLRLAMEIRRDLDTGGISVRHQEHLISAVYQTKGILQKHLTRRLYGLIGRDPAVTRQSIRTLYIAGYLSIEEYGSLLCVFAKVAPPGEPKAERVEHLEMDPAIY